MVLLRTMADEYDPDQLYQDPGSYTPAPPPVGGTGPDPSGGEIRTIDPFAPKGNEPTNPQPKGGGGGTLVSPLSGRPSYRFGPVPQFAPPQFAAPTLAEAQNEPGYALRLQAGQDALQRSAAAKGILRTGGTLKDLAQWSQDFAASEYANVFNRSLQTFDRRYRGEHDAFAPRLAEWQTMSQAEIQAALAQFNREWQMYALEHAGSGGGGGGPYDPEPMPPEVTAY